MEKIPTIFDRDWDGLRGVIAKRTVTVDSLTYPTEKIDGTNVRLTIRKENLVRLEKRRNPNKAQKLIGIETPWYVDANEDDPQDKHIWQSAKFEIDNYQIPDGEWPGEAVGPGIQGNYYALKNNRVILFSLDRAPLLHSVPTDYYELRDWLPKQMSHLNPKVPIEGVVWHGKDGMYKIKTKDFK